MTNKLSKQIFSIPLDSDNYLIYAPLKSVAFLANSKLVNLINEQCDSDGQIYGDSLRFLHYLDFFNPEPLPKDEYLDKGIHYDAIILFLTNQCNLRCTYCYASSGEFTPLAMKWEIARAAMDNVLKEAVKKGTPSITLGFHGGGEPTMSWDIFKKAVQYIQEAGRKNSLEVHISGSFNGYLPKRKLDFIINNFTELSMSFDGIPLVQNLQRPTKNKGESFSKVSETLDALDGNHFKYGIRITVTDDSLRYMEECVSLICERHNPQKIQIEPVFLEGRANKTDTIKDFELFVSQFIRSHEIADRRGIDLFYSGAREGVLTQRFCLAACRAFVVTPEGDVTTCFETFGREHPLSEKFIVGRYAGKGEFLMDNDKLSKHFSRVVDNIPYCEACFCKWHCAGDCAIKSSQQSEADHFEPTERCQINRELTKYLILRNIIKSGGLIWKGNI